MDKLQHLLDIYRPDPCRTLPNAFWKTAARLADSHMTVSGDVRGQLSSLAIREGERLLAFWCADPAIHSLTQREIDMVRFALVHAIALPVFAQHEFAHKQPYFRLVHEGAVDVYPLPAGFAFVPVRPKLDTDAVVRLIRDCYPAIKVSSEIVQAWLDHPVYDPELWLWVIDTEKHEKAGLGIAERDPQVPEASLEWIQVLPAYREQGLGRAIVSELMRRVSGKVKFTTVAGELTNVHQPHKLYQRCGFIGEDVWWVLSD